MAAARWLYEEGIGENRAIRIAAGEILEAAIELPGLRAGTIVEGRLTAILMRARRGIVTLSDGTETLIEPLPARLTEGAALHVEVMREPVSETGRDKLPKVRASDAAPQSGPSLRSRIGSPQPLLATGTDLFEEAGWSELVEQAVTGIIPFTGGALRMSLTPAMTLFDVDGALPPAALAEAGAAASARAIRRLGITGSIGIDLPTLPDRADRQRAATAVDPLLPQPFERTAVNGFGFLQIVRRRERPSIPELVLADPVGVAARQLLRRAERAGGGNLILAAAPAVIARLEREPAWLALLSTKVGGTVGLSAEPGLTIWSGYVHRSSQL